MALESNRSADRHFSGEPVALGGGVSCWVLTDGKAGDELQCVGVARALGCPVEVRRVRPRPPFVWMMPRGCIDPREAPARPGSPIAPPFPDILIASGRRAVAYVRAVKRASGGRTFTVILKDPRIGARAADLIWVPAHDRLRGPNVITTLTAPHHVSRQRLAAARAAPPPALARLPRPRVAVLAGGDSRHHRFTPADVARFLDLLAGLTEEGAALMATTSRRTPEALREGLGALVTRTGGYLWDGRGEAADNPYIALLALADSVVVTADSANMLGEAAATGAPLLVFEPSGGHRKLTMLLNGLEKCGIARPLRGRLEGNAYLPLDTTVTVAGEIIRSFHAHRARLAIVADQAHRTENP
ncbi:MAG: mitochondrial fission ELM1 family protein [Pseudochelatococcus sp.]|jgi:mitochondrial fission protein ELM1|uniref:mitochondrial fission ELM1 family protein n=1 Tax=Pseudochelatococcus sp. TaxID=2020869 RepID=UPI003D8B5E22